jgi:hypothetical protein
LQADNAEPHLIAETMDKIYNLEAKLEGEILNQNIYKPLSTICEEDNINNSKDILDCSKNNSVSNNLDHEGSVSNSLLPNDFDFISYLESLEYDSNIGRDTKITKNLVDMYKTFMDADGNCKDLDSFIKLVEIILNEPENSKNRMLKTFLQDLKTYEEYQKDTPTQPTANDFDSSKVDSRESYNSQNNHTPDFRDTLQTNTGTDASSLN